MIDRGIDDVRRHLQHADLARLGVEAGFPHESHMTQAFRERIGTTPDVLRRSGSRAPGRPDHER